LEQQQEQKTEVEKTSGEVYQRIRKLANKILDEKSNKFTEQNKENMKTS
jgi:DNA recombination protein RmuC